MNAKSTGPIVAFPAMRHQVNRSAAADFAFEEAVGCAQSGDTEGEELALLDALRIYPDHALANINYGTRLYRRGELEQALFYYNRAIAADPFHAVAHFNKANTLEELGEPGKAMEAWRIALDLNPDYADAHYNLARVYMKAGENRKALRHWSAYIALGADGKWSEYARKQRKRLIAQDRLKIVHRRDA